MTHVQGYHVARLAADFHDVLEALALDVRPFPSSDLYVCAAAGGKHHLVVQQPADDVAK